MLRPFATPNRPLPRHFLTILRHHKCGSASSWNGRRPIAYLWMCQEFLISHDLPVFRETMSTKGTLKDCVLLKAQAAPAPQHFEQPAVFEVCCKCGCDVDGDLQDKNGRSICPGCLEAKEKKGLGWFKNLRGTLRAYCLTMLQQRANDHSFCFLSVGEASEESKTLKAKVGNVSKRFGLSKEKLPTDLNSPSPTPSNGSAAAQPPEKKDPTPAHRPTAASAPGTSSVTSVRNTLLKKSNSTVGASSTPAVTSSSTPSSGNSNVLGMAARFNRSNTEMAPSVTSKPPTERKPSATVPSAAPSPQPPSRPVAPSNPPLAHAPPGTRSTMAGYKPKPLPASPASQLQEARTLPAILFSFLSAWLIPYDPSCRAQCWSPVLLWLRKTILRRRPSGEHPEWILASTLPHVHPMQTALRSDEVRSEGQPTLPPRLRQRSLWTKVLFVFSSARRPVRQGWQPDGAHSMLCLR